MGFKQIDIKELETIMSPVFIGIPLKHIEKEETLTTLDKEVKFSNIEYDSNILIRNEETLDFKYNNRKILESFTGMGNITILNNSKKDRVWDVNLKLSDCEKINLDKDELINFGNFDPKNSKNISYTISNSEDLLDLIDLNENIEVMNINAKSIHELKSELYKPIKDDDVESKDDIITEENELSPEKETSEEKLKADYANMDDINKKLDELRAKKTELEKVRSNLENDFKTLINSILKAQGLKDKKKITEFNSQEILGLESKIKKLSEQIKLTEKEVLVVEDEYLKKEKTIKEEVSEDLNPKIEEFTLKLDVEQEDFNQSSKELEEQIVKKKNQITIVKNLKKAHNILIKEESKALKNILNEDSKKKEVKEKYHPKINDMEIELKDNQSKLDVINQKIKKLTDRNKKSKENLKNLKKQISTTTKTKDTLLNTKVNENTKIKTNNIKSLRNKISEKEKKIIKLKEIIEEYNPKIKNIEARLETEQRSLNDIIAEINELVKKKELLDDKIKDLENERDIQLDGKSKDLKEESLRKKEMLMSFDSDDNDLNNEPIKSTLDTNSLILFNKLNLIKFTIVLKNRSNFVMRNTKLIKNFPPDFSNFKFDSKAIANTETNKNQIIFSIKDLKPNEEIAIIIHTDIKPKEKKIFGTGEIRLSFEFRDCLISGIEFENFTAYSHALHAIKKKEQEDAPNLWNCSLIFKNNSDMDMELRSILILDKDKKNKLIDLKFNDKNGKKIIKHGDKFISKEWQIHDKFEPKFYRKLEYSVIEKSEKISRININFEEDIFEIVNLSISKKLSKSEIKSFEETKLEDLLIIKNIGTTPVKGLLIREEIPADFIPPIEKSDFRIKTSSGRKDFEDLKINIYPNNQDSSVPHILEIAVNLDVTNSDCIIDIDEYLEIRYFFNAIAPDHKKSYVLPLIVKSYYPKEKFDQGKLYIIENELNKNELPELKIMHKRRDLLVSKEIFPGRELDEFAISLMVINNSNIEVKNVKIKDTISQSFKFISSNIKSQISELDGVDSNLITFEIDNILPFQEEEVRYYVKNISGEKISFDKLESFVFG